MRPQTVEALSIQAPVIALPEAPPTEPSPEQPRPRLHFWEVDQGFKCPIVGMCLSQAEQKRLIKKVGYSIKKKSAFELHEILVASAEGENRLSVKIDNLLQRKFGKAADKLGELDDAAFMTRFKAAFAAGECIDILWAAAVNPDLSLDVKRDIFGEIHMAMHWSGEQSLMLKRKHVYLERELEDLQARLNSVSRERRKVQRENDALRQGNLKFQADIASLKAENARLLAVGTQSPRAEALESLEAEQMAMADTISKLRQQAKRQHGRVNALKKKNRQLLAKARQQREANQRIQTETRSIIAEMMALNRCNTSCPSFDLCKKRILIVGGVTRMETLYRELIEGSGGRFDYHDGYMKNGVRQLESRLRRADVILCPVSCNSHAACSLVKNLGKKHNKPVHMLPNSSLTTVSQVIWGERNGKVRLN